MNGAMKEIVLVLMNWGVVDGRLEGRKDGYNNAIQTVERLRLGMTSLLDIRLLNSIVNHLHVNAPEGNEYDG